MTAAAPAAFAGSQRNPFSLSDHADSYFDLGTEPPLSAGAQSVGAPARRAVSMRWLGGTILTGFTSFVLIGGALVAALNGQEMVANAPEAADMAALNAGLANGQKGDRIIPVEAPPTSREIIPVAMVVTEGDRELIQQRDFVLIRTALAITNPDGVEVPAYDPITIVSEAAAGEVASGPAIGEDFARAGIEGGNAAVRTSAFPIADAEIRGPELGAAEVEEIIHRNAPYFAQGELAPGALAYANAIGLDFEGGGADPFAALGVRMIPENVSYLGKTAEGGVSRDERLLPLGERTIEEVLADTTMSETDIAAALAVFDGIIDLSALGPEHRVRIAQGSGESGATVLRVSIYENEAHQATVARNDSGVFVRADEPPEMSNLTIAADPAPRPAQGTVPRLYEALYLTGHSQGVSEDQVNELVRIFAFDLDMQARISPSDALTLFYADTAEGADDPAILYASVANAGGTTAYYRFQTEDGSIRYYDFDGRSADNFLLRKPMSVGEMRSGYGNRLHPILGVYRLHSGVDWAAPYGTPIVAAGDGEIVRMEWNSGGYGRYTVVRHSNGYETAYAHQSGFADGLGVGSTVRQGQVIGYVGSTGQSTGNHLHYEVRINGQTVNPLTIRLPEGDVLSGDQLLAFEEQRDQVNDLLGIGPDGTQVAANR